MGLFDGIKNWSSRRAIEKVGQGRRNCTVRNLHDARRVGILFESSSEGFFILIKQLVAHLREEHGIGDVKALGYVDSKEEPVYHRHDLFFDYFTKKETSWAGIPKADATARFIEEDYDILIDCTRGNCTPLNFVRVASKAHFKVGRKNDQSSEHDLIIQIDEDGTFDRYISLALHFLTQINHHAA